MTAHLSLHHAPVPTTLKSHAHLFKIITPIKVDWFEALLKDHLKRAFVEEGFWPWADSWPDNYPETWNESKPMPRDDRSAQFLRDQRDQEIALGRFSEGFGPDLLPGMYSMPIHAVPNAEPFALNLMISKENFQKAVLNSIPTLGHALRSFRSKHGNVRLIDGCNHIDHCNCFGGRGSLATWLSFFCLVIWIAIIVELILILNYIDDNFGFEHDGCEDGPKLTVIGFEIDLNAMTASLLLEGMNRLVMEVLAGYVNWSFNVFPLLKPAHNNIYAKIAGKRSCHAKIWINTAIVADLTWLVDRVRDLNRQFDPDVELAYVDACGLGLGLYFPWLNLAYYLDLPGSLPGQIIFFWEAVAVCSAICKVATFSTRHRITRVGIYSDNDNTVSIFNSLRAQPAFNPILKTSVDTLITADMHLYVDFIPGRLNVMADAIFHTNFTFACERHTGLQILLFTPPHDALGGTKK
ncbi:hypothetical protein OBBRIDRAFT_815650 [Obba rivulosa]|uniref:Uncharacterized protein n=1 Tax=Obba rivulosa TaxID=1052685 RepID=A0A8E2ALB5_9APHY|nr:hypothetical protein OBBRIDRAFT_815650 [Obba rivulosa]